MADVCMLSVAFIWGVNMPIMKFALARVDEYLFNAMRLAISAVVLGLIFWWRGDRLVDWESKERSPRKQILLIVLFAFLSGFAYQVLFLLGINQTSAGNTALIMSALPVWTALLAMLLINERLNRNAWIGLFIALTGTVVVTLTVPASPGTDGSITGNMLVAAATFAWALGSVGSRPIMKQVSPIGLAFAGVAIAVPFHFLVAAHALDEIGKFFTDGWLLLSLLFSGAFSTGLAYAFWNFGVKTLGTSHAAIYQNLVPFVALIASWFLIGEIPVWMQLVGGVVIIVGLVVMRKNRQPV